MQSFIACNDRSIAAKLRICLANVGVESSTEQFMSHESAELSFANQPDGSSLIVFFGSPKLADEDLVALRKLCAVCENKAKVVVVGEAFSVAAILQAVRSGAFDCVTMDSNFETELRHLLDRLQIAANGHRRLGRLFTIVSPVGGTGASVLAINLAAILAERQQHCALLDLHIRGGDLATLLNSRPRHNLVSLAGKTDQLDRTMLDQSLFKHECGVHLLASGEPFSDWRLIRPELIHKIVQLARTGYDNVVVDLEDADHSEQIRTLAMSDQIIVPMRPDFVSLNRTRKVLDFWKSASVSREHITLVLNRFGQPKQLPINLIEEALGCRIAFKVADDPLSMNEAINLGVPLITAFPNSKAATDLVQLANWLIGTPQTKSPPRLLTQMRDYGQTLQHKIMSASQLFG